MIIDDYGTVGYTENEVIAALRKNPSIDLDEIYLQDGEKYIKALTETCFELPQIKDWNTGRQYNEPVESYHRRLQTNWFMPEEYKDCDIEHVLYEKCREEEQFKRVQEELALYKKFNLFPLLCYLRYLRELARKHNIVWGVGRGSSCSSYCLFLLDIHMVDSIKYRLDIHEFLREEE